MSKLETVRALNDSAPQLQLVESMRSLQQAVRGMAEDLKRLPESIASETAGALQPLSGLRQEVTRVLEAYETVVALQRKTLDELTEQMIRSASGAFEQKAGELGATIGKLSLSLSRMEQSAEQIQSLPGALVAATQSLQSAAVQLRAAANATRPVWWEQAVGLILAGTVGALLVATGHAAFGRLLPPSGLQKDAAWAQAVWSQASPKERELLKQIALRRGN
jgi:hypothetical protein